MKLTLDDRIRSRLEDRKFSYTSHGRTLTDDLLLLVAIVFFEKIDWMVRYDHEKYTIVHRIFLQQNGRT